MLSFRFAKWKMRHAPRLLQMAVVSQSSVKFGKKREFLVGTTNFKRACLRKPDNVCKSISLKLKKYNYVGSFGGVNQWCKAIEKVSEGSVEISYPQEGSKNPMIQYGSTNEPHHSVHDHAMPASQKTRSITP